jgi:type I restriction enzyme S subunit
VNAPRVELGAIAEFINGAAFKPDDWGESGRRIIRIQNLTDESKPYNRTTREVPSKLVVYPGDLLVSWSATLGVFEWAGPDEALLNQHIFRVLPDARRVERRYLRHGLELALGEMQRHLHGATMQHVNRGEFLATKLLLPALSEQRRIAELLDRAEALRAKRRAALAQLDTLTQSIFLEMFGDPLGNPMNWPLVRFEDLCNRVTVGIVVQPASYYVSEGIPALRSLNVRAGSIDLEFLVYFSERDNATKLAKTRLKTGDLVLVRSGQPGTASVVPPDLDGVNAIDLLIATPKGEIADSTFLCAFFNSSGGRDLVLSKQRGQVQKHLNVGSLNEARLPLPPLRMQREYARRVVCGGELRKSVLSSVRELDSLFGSLQHRAFRGEL